LFWQRRGDVERRPSCGMEEINIDVCLFVAWFLIFPSANFELVEI
jgi:hypothetical protein